MSRYDVGELLQARRVRQHEVVRQQDRERIVADEGAGAPDGVAQSQRHLLAHGDHRAGFDLGLTQRLERISLVARAQRGLELERDVEMFHQCRLAAAGDHAELLDARRARLLDRVLNQRLVDHRQHFLGDRLGGRQEPRAEARDGQNSLAQGLDHDELPQVFPKPVANEPAAANIAGRRKCGVNGDHGSDTCLRDVSRWRVLRHPVRLPPEPACPSSTSRA